MDRNPFSTFPSFDEPMPTPGMTLHQLNAGREEEDAPPSKRMRKTEEVERMVEEFRAIGNALSPEFQGPFSPSGHTQQQEQSVAVDLIIALESSQNARAMETTPNSPAPAENDLVETQPPGDFLNLDKQGDDEDEAFAIAHEYVEEQAENHLPAGVVAEMEPEVQGDFGALQGPEDAVAALANGHGNTEEFIQLTVKALTELKSLATDGADFLSEVKDHWEARARILHPRLNPWSVDMNNFWRNMAFHLNGLFLQARDQIKLHSHYTHEVQPHLAELHDLYWKKVLPSLIRVVEGVPFGTTKKNEDGRNNQDVYSQRLKFQPGIEVLCEVSPNGRKLIFGYELCNAELTVLGAKENPALHTKTRAQLSNNNILYPRGDEQRQDTITLRQAESGHSVKFHKQRAPVQVVGSQRQAQIPDRLGLRLHLREQDETFDVVVPLAGDFIPCSADSETLGNAFPAVLARQAEGSGSQLPDSVDIAGFVSLAEEAIKSVALTQAEARLAYKTHGPNSAAATTELLSRIETEMGELVNSLQFSCIPVGAAGRVTTEELLPLLHKEAWKKLYQQAENVGRRVANTLAAQIRQGVVAV